MPLLARGALVWQVWSQAPDFQPQTGYGGFGPTPLEHTLPSEMPMASGHGRAPLL